MERFNYLVFLDLLFIRALRSTKSGGGGEGERFSKGKSGIIVYDSTPTPTPTPERSSAHEKPAHR